MGGVGLGAGGLFFEAGRLFEVGANSRLGAYSNEYGTYIYRTAMVFIHSAVHISDLYIYIYIYIYIFITLHHHPFTGL